MEKLRSYIHSLIDLSEEAWKVFRPALTTLEYKKGDFKRPASGLDINLDCSQYDVIANDSTYVQQEPAWDIDD